jgi:hypothetical protein
MARLTDSEVLERFRQALADWKFEGAVQLQGRAKEGLRLTLEGVTEKHFKEALFRYVCEGNGEVDQVREQREPWRDFWEWHYDLRPTINGVKLYVETRLDPESFCSDKDPSVIIVQVKPA